MQDARRIVVHILGLADNQVAILSPSQLVNVDNAGKTLELAKRIASGYPLEYAIGHTSFFGYKLKVNKSVLIPRPDTEFLVISAERHIRSNSKVLDLCTGSGCIAISLKIRNPGISVVASDISDKALEIATSNAKLHGVDIEFVESDMFDKIKEKFDIIVSNPPYIPSASLDNLEPEISYEPSTALDGGDDGMDYYKIIESSLDNRLEDDGILIVEIEKQSSQTIPVLFEIFSDWSISIENDLTSRPRMLVIRRRNNE